jgi:thymidylate kinase
MEIEQRNANAVHLGSYWPLLVSFSGIDGAGKTTQIESLTRWLRDAGIKVRLIRFWDDVALLRQCREWFGHKLFKGDKGIGTPERPIERRDKNVSNWYMSACRPFLCCLDVIGLWCMVSKLKRGQTADVVIFDRYLYDQVANLNLGDRGGRALVRALLRLMPRPDVPCLLDADPELARSRKPEYPMDFLRQNRKSYLILARIARMEVIPAGSTDEVTRNVRRAVMNKLSRIQDHSVDLEEFRMTDCTR